MYLFIYLFICLFIYSFIHLFIYLINFDQTIVTRLVKTKLAKMLNKNSESLVYSSIFL